MQDILFNPSTIAHLLIGFYFVFLGFWNIYHWVPVMEIMIKNQIPHPYLLLPISISCQIILGFMVIFGIFLKIAVLILIPFTIIAVFLFHPFWKFSGEVRKLNFSLFIANLTVVLGALLLV